MSQTEIIQAADRCLRQAGLFPSPIIADGRKHRCPVEGKPKGQDGEYRIYADDRPRLVWKNYRTGQYGTDKLYFSDSADSLDRAEYILSKAVTAVSNHPYLVPQGHHRAARSEDERTASWSSRPMTPTASYGPSSS